MVGFMCDYKTEAALRGWVSLRYISVESLIILYSRGEQAAMDHANLPSAMLSQYLPIRVA